MGCEGLCSHSLLTLIAMLTGCVDSERLDAAAGGRFEVWWKRRANAGARDGLARYAFVVRNIEALRVEGTTLSLAAAATRATRLCRDHHRHGQSARRAERIWLSRRLRSGSGAGNGQRGLSLDSRARGGGGRLASPLRRHHAPGAGRGNVRVRGYADGERCPRHAPTLYRNSHGGFHGDGATFMNCAFPGGRQSRGTPCWQKAVGCRCPQPGRLRFLHGDSLPADLLHGRSGPRLAGWKTAGGALRTRRRATTAISPISSSGCTTRTRRRCTTGNMTPEEGRGCEGCAKGRSSPCCSRSYRCRAPARSRRVLEGFFVGKLGAELGDGYEVQCVHGENQLAPP